MDDFKLIEHPNPILRTRCEPVPVTEKHDPSGLTYNEVTFDDDLGPLLSFMQDTLLKNEAVGLAANQCGIAKRIFLMQRFYMTKIHTRISFTPRDEIAVVINPVILERSPELMIFVEGCLSFPKRNVRTRRPGAVKVGYFNEKGQGVCEVLDGLESIIFQHEFDHLNGKDFRDRQYLGRA